LRQRFFVLRSTDGGASFETHGSLPRHVMTIPDDGAGAADRTITRTFSLETGHYMINIMAGSHQIQTFTVSLTTAHVITAYV